MSILRKRWLLFISIALMATSLAVRAYFFPHSNEDLDHYNLIWYQAILSQGITTALSTAFTNYSPPYSYLLALASLFNRVVNPIIALKFIPAFFDLFSAIMIYKIVRLKFSEGPLPILASAFFFAAPTIILNSSLWGQVDSIYTFFLLIALYFLLTKKETSAWLALGVSFAVKAQSIFFAPLFLVLLLQKRLSWKGVLWIPVVYAFFALPTILLGRSAMDVFTVYITQSETFHTIARNVPNFYSFLPQFWYTPALWIGLTIAAITLLGWTLHSRTDASASQIRERLILYATLSASLMPFLLPKMHDRYFYLADVLSILLAFFSPQLWFVPILAQIASMLSYSIFLFNGSYTFVLIGALVYTFAIAIMLKKQEEGMASPASLPVRIASIMLTVSIPMILLGVGMRSVLTPFFMRMEYQFIQIGTEQKQGQFERDSLALEFVTVGKSENFLRRIQGLNDPERQALIILQSVAKNMFSLWHISLLTFFTANLLFWVYGNFAQWRKAFIDSGQVIMGSAPLIAVLFFVRFRTYNSSARSILEILSSEYWLASAIWVLVFMVFTGFIITRITFKD